MPPLPKTKATAKRGGLREGQSCLSNFISNAERGVAFSAEGFLYVISIKSYELDNACFVLKKKIHHLKMNLRMRSFCVQVLQVLYQVTTSLDDDSPLTDR